MDIKKIKALLKVLADSDIAEIEVEEDGFKLTVRKNATAVMIQAPAAAPPMYPPMMPPMGYPPMPAMPHMAPQMPAAAPVAAAPVATPAAAPVEEEAGGLGPNDAELKSPIVGTFYGAPSPDDSPFVKVGDKVSVGDTLCIVEAMKLMNEIEAEMSGTIKAILIEDAQPVEFDQPLFIITK